MTFHHVSLLTIGGASRKRGAGSSSTHEDLKLGENPAGGIASLKKRLITSSFFKESVLRVGKMD